MTERRIAWLSIPTIIVLAIGLAVVAAGSDDPELQSLEIFLEEGELQAVEVFPAGTVTLTRTRSYLKIESADANPGYSSQVLVAEAAGQYVEAHFTGEDQQFVFTALLHEGRVRIAIDQEPIIEPDPTPTTTSSTITNPTTTSTTAPPTTTVPPTISPPTTPPPATAPATTSPPTTASPTTTTAAPPTTTTLAPKVADGDVTYSLGPAGTVVVTLRDGEFHGVDLDLDGGWDVEADQVGPDQIDLLLGKGGQRVIWQAYIAEGEVVVNLELIAANG